MSRESLTERRWPGSASPVPQVHHNIAVGAQYGVVHGYGEGPEQPLAKYGYDEYKTGYLGVDGRGSRDTSPSRPAQEPRDMV